MRKKVVKIDKHVRDEQPSFSLWRLCSQTGAQPGFC